MTPPVYFNLETLFVTGHSGFIGSHLVSYLSQHYKIIGMGKTKLKNSKIVQINQDINDLSSKNIPKNVSCVIHLAALTDVKNCEKNPKKCFEVNVQGSQTLLEICRKRNLKLIFLSTSHVFGFPKKNPIPETHPRNPLSIYAASKLCGEILCESYSKTYDMDVAIIRLFSIYGPRTPDHLVTSKIITQILTKNTVNLGNLNSKRDFLYIDDAMEAISLILKKWKGFDSFNVGSGTSHSISELIRMLKRISKKNPKIKKIKSAIQKNDIPEIVSDSTKIRKLGWIPKTNLSEGLNLTYNWYYEKLTSKK